jgi:hypothetical protein
MAETGWTLYLLARAPPATVAFQAETKLLLLFICEVRMMGALLNFDWRWLTLATDWLRSGWGAPLLVLAIIVFWCHVLGVNPLARATGGCFDDDWGFWDFDNFD